MMVQRTRIGDIADVLRGTTAANTVDEANAPRFFGLAEISERRISEPRYPDQTADLSRAVYLKAGDVVIALLGRLGESALIDEQLAGAVLGRECAAIRLRGQGVAVTPGWLYAWTRSHAFRQLVETRSSGTTMPRLSVRSLKELEIPIAPMDLQRSTADRLAELGAAIEAMDRTSTALRRLRDIEIDLAVMDEWGEGSHGRRRQPRKVRRLRRA
jgi:hypothetical protein